MKLLIVGAGGHGKVCAEVAEKQGYTVRFLDERFPAIKAVEHWEVVGRTSDFSNFVESNQFFVAIGCNSTRNKITSELLTSNAQLVSLIHPKAQVSQYAQVGKGVLIGASAVVNGFSQLHLGCIVNTAAVIEHDVIVRAFTHISPGAIMLGASETGVQAWIGANAVVFPTIKVGAYTILGASSFTNKDLENKSIYAGCPAKRIKETQED